MRTRVALAISLITMLISDPAVAAVNLGTLSGNRIETFSYGPGTIDFVFNFKLENVANVKVTQSDFTVGGTIASSLSISSSPPDLTPPATPSSTGLDFALISLGNIDAQLVIERDLLQIALQNSDDAGAQLQLLKIQQLINNRQQVVDILTSLLGSPAHHPQLLLAAANVSSANENTQELSGVLADGTYSLFLSGIATGSGGGSLRFEVNPIIADAVPEPATWAMMLIGFVAISIAARRSKRRRNEIQTNYL